MTVATNDEPASIEDMEPDIGERAETPEPRTGGCLGLGWGCLPVFVGLFIGVPALWL